MALADVDVGSHLLVVWREPSFSPITLDPDSDLSNGIGNANGYTLGRLVEMTQDSGPGITTEPSHGLVRSKSQTSLQTPPKHRPGRRGGVCNFGVRGVAGNTQLAGVETPDGGPYENLISASFGEPMTAAARTTASGAGTTTTIPLTDATNYAAGMLICVEDVTAPGATLKAIRLVTLMAGSTATVNRSLGFSPAATDIVRPLLTWRPHQQPFNHRTVYAKRRARALAPVEGQAIDFSGVGLTMAFETPDVGMEPIFRFSGRADDWAMKIAENLNLTASIVTSLPPLLLDSVWYFNGVATEAAKVSVDPRIELAERSATSGTQGRSGWTHKANEDGPLWTVEVPYDPDWYTNQRAGTLYPLELHFGANSRETTNGNDHSYFSIFTPAAVIASVEEIARNNMKYQRVTLEAVRSETLNQTDLYPFYFGVPGRYV